MKLIRIWKEIVLGFYLWNSWEVYATCQATASVKEKASTMQQALTDNVAEEKCDALVLGCKLVERHRCHAPGPGSQAGRRGHRATIARVGGGADTWPQG